MFGFSRRRMKLGRLKIQLSESNQGIRSPIGHPKRGSSHHGQGITPRDDGAEESNFESSSVPLDFSKSTSGDSENWVVLTVNGDKPLPRFNHAAAIVGSKMVVVGGESDNRLLEDVQVLNFDPPSWSPASSKLYLSPTSLPHKIPACKGHALVAWGKKILLVGGKTDPASDKVSIWAFDTETEVWTLVASKGDIPVARSGHTVVRASSFLILFGGEDVRRRKLNDLHMFDLKSFTWFPLHCRGQRPSARSNHVATFYDDKLLLVFGGTSKSRTLNDLYSLDYETMTWSRIKTRGLHPSPRTGCCGVLCGSKWYITGGGSKKKRHAETFVFDVLKHEWSIAVASAPSSITTNKGYSLVLVQHKERDFLVAFGGVKKDPSNKVEILMVEKITAPHGRKSTLSKGTGTALAEKLLAPTASSGQLIDEASNDAVYSMARQNISLAVEHHGSGRRSLSESLLVDSAPASGNVSLRKQFHDEEDIVEVSKMPETRNSLQVQEHTSKHHHDTGVKTSFAGHTCFEEEPLYTVEGGNLGTHRKQGSGNFSLDGDEYLFQERDGRSESSAHSGIYQFYETKLAGLIRRNGILEGQLATAVANHEAAEKNLSVALKSRHEIDKKLADTLKEMELLKEKLAGVELAQDEANNLSNIVHSDNVRLEHNVAFLEAVLDDTQKELHSTRGVLAGERARAFQLQVEVFHLKQRLQSMENRAQTPRKPFHV